MSLLIDSELLLGIESFLSNYVHVSTTDNILIAYTSDSREVTAVLLTLLQKKGVNTAAIWMYPIVDEAFSSRLLDALNGLRGANERITLITLERDTMSHDDAIRKTLALFGTEHSKVFRIISASRELFTHTMRALPTELSGRNTTILEKVLPAAHLRIQTESGTDLTVVIDNHKYKWVSNRGIWRTGRYVILPAGEVATFPVSVDGVFVADFAFNLNAVTDRDTRLVHRPVTLRVSNGTLQTFSCGDRDLSAFLDRCFSSGCSNRIGELGFGTNYAVVDAIAMNSHINERRPGVHLGFGQHNQDPEIVGYRCDIHLDLIADGGLVWCGDQETPIDLANLTASLNPHPEFFRDEDVFSPRPRVSDDDCCGVLATGEMALCNPESLGHHASG